MQPAMVHVEPEVREDSLWVPRAPEPHFGYTFGKRALDIVTSVVALVALAPLLLAIALLVKLTSPGPILFGQERCGRSGASFRMLKFRTMVVDAEQRNDELSARARRGEIRAVDAPMFKAQDDPRVTRVGKYLRRLSLDELPQVLNVLRGDMSLVGPRPLVFPEAHLLPERSRMRHAVPPGITCIWQTSGRSRVPYERRMAMDIEYVNRRSLRLDIGLLAKTPLAVLRGDGAY